MIKDSIGPAHACAEAGTGSAPPRQAHTSESISKATLDVHRLETGAVAQFSNSPAGLRELRRWIGKTMPEVVVYESTGPCHGALERTFGGVLPLKKVNPLQARRFAQARGTRAKTDKVDAYMLARMGAAFDLVADKPADKDAHVLKELQGARRAMINERTRLINRRQVQTLAITRRHTKARIDQLKRQIAEIDEELLEVLRRSPERAGAFEHLCSLPGIGRVSAVAILVECPEIGTLTKKEAASLAGVAPMARESGQWRGQAFIQGGRKFLRQALYMPALVASRHHPELREKYQAMIAAGKPPKVALVALMRKLLIQANAVVGQEREWAPKKA